MSAAMPEMPSPLLFTDNAANKVKELIEEEKNPALMLRVFVSGGGSFTVNAAAVPVSGHVTVNGSNPTGCVAGTSVGSISFGDAWLHLTCNGSGEAAFSGYLTSGTVPVSIAGSSPGNLPWDAPKVTEALRVQ